VRVRHEVACSHMLCRAHRVCRRVTAGLIATDYLGATPPTDFAIGTAVLALLAATVAALPPAMIAAHQDPVAVLRAS
jgi:ABC-type lipoprotein release transport system permease subunit